MPAPDRTETLTPKQDEAVEPESVDLIDRECSLRHLAGHDAVGTDLGKITHPTQEAVRDSRCATGAAGDLSAAFSHESNVE